MLGEPVIEGTPGTCRLCGQTRFFPSGLLLEPEDPEARGRAEKEAKQAAADWFSLN
jgi:hypothetical protein